MKLAGLFPGQGSQVVGMGKELAESHDAARAAFERADTALGFSLSGLCFDGPIEELTLTKHAQPAILTSSYAALQVSGLTPAAAAGHSLGEYTALVAAGVLDFADAVQLVYKRGTYMQEAVAPGAGKMLAVMGPTPEELETAIGKVTDGVVEIANLNCPGQTVIAGNVAGVDGFTAVMQDSGAKLIPLNVSAPFHCQLMAPAAEKLGADLEATTFNDPAFPVYSNVTAKVIESGAQARDLLKQQVVSSVRWTDSMVNMLEEQGITHSVEFGPGGVLSKLLKRIQKGPTMLQVFDGASLEKSQTSL